MKIKIPHNQKYMIWHQDHSNRTIILGFIQKRIFGDSQWRPYFKMAAIDIFLIG